MNIYYETTKAIIRIFHLLFRQDCHVSGNLALPEGAKIIAGNHPNATDGLFLPFVFNEQLHFFMQGDIYDLFYIHWLLAGSDQIKVDPQQKMLAVEQGIKLLKQGKVVALFPEARLNPDGQAMRSNTGAIRLTLLTHAPIIPVGFYVPPKNLHHISRMKLGRVSQGHWQTHGHCYLHIGSPWLPGEEFAGQIDKEILYKLTERLMEKINEQAQLAMQAYTKETGLPAELASFSK
jgi:1-acyl-sn-glycerol-3-phosphate acyltransferase